MSDRIKISSVVLTHAHSNCYMLETDDAAICIDTGAFDERVLSFLERNADKQLLILLTHGHFDHIGGAGLLREKTGVKIAIGRLDAPALLDGELSLSDRFRAHIAPFAADIMLSDGEELTVGSIKIKAIHTAGHTVGGMCYLTDDVIFTGDTLFAGTVGRTDFTGGDMDEILRSVKRIVAVCSDETVVLPGHNSPTTIDREKRNNPYIRL